jgi:hypothetical protein
VAIFLVIATALVIGGTRDNLILTIALLGIGGAIVRIWQIVILLRLSGLPARTFFKPYIRYAVYSIPWFLGVLAAVTWGSLLIVFAVSAIGGAGYLATVVIRDGLLKTQIPGSAPPRGPSTNSDAE